MQYCLFDMGARLFGCDSLLALPVTEITGFSIVGFAYIVFVCPQFHCEGEQMVTPAGHSWKCGSFVKRDFVTGVKLSHVKRDFVIMCAFSVTATLSVFLVSMSIDSHFECRFVVVRQYVPTQHCI